MNVNIIGHTGMSGGGRLTFTLVKGLNEVGIAPTIYTRDREIAPEGFVEGAEKYDVKRTHNLRAGVYTMWLESFLHPKPKGFTFNLTNNPFLNKFSDVWYFCTEREHQLRSMPSRLGRLSLPYFSRISPLVVRAYSGKIPKYTISRKVKGQVDRIAPENDVQILHPPTDTSFRPQKKNPNTIAYISRFQEAKRQLEVIHLADRLPSHEFHIMGSTNPDGRTGEQYARICQDESTQYANVHLILNPSTHQIREVLGRSEYFINPEINPDWSISTVEAIYSGCIPIVHDSGAFREIVPQSENRFTNLYDVPHLLPLPPRQKYNHLSKTSDKHYISTLLSHL